MISGTLRDRLKRALEREHLSLWELCEGNVEGGLLSLGTLEDMYSKVLEMVVFLHSVRNGEHEGDIPSQGLCEKGEILYYQETLFIREYERDISVSPFLNPEDIKGV